jgi:hypothetical protein
MFNVLASLALAVGGISSTMVLTEGERLAAEEVRGLVAEVEALDTVETPEIPSDGRAPF